MKRGKRREEHTSRERPSWDEYFVNLVIETAKRSSCLKRNVGALIVKDNIILTTGYNGAPRNINSCFDNDKCWRKSMKIRHGENKDLCMAVHAEANAIYHSAKKGISIEDSELYVTTYPCPSCAKAVINTGIKKVNFIFPYYGEQYEFSRYLLKKAGVKTRRIRLHKNIENKLIR